MENYYVPSIEEFFIGFEFEFAGLDNNWNKQPFQKVKLGYDNLFGLYTLEHMVGVYKDPSDVKHENHVRVRLLDREDIESFGFTDFQHSVEDWYKLKQTIECPISHHTYQALRLRHNYKESGITIVAYEYDFQMEKDEEGVNLFRGIIKNKSEFKRILAKLNIKNE